jgi:hypothetical protein
MAIDKSKWNKNIKVSQKTIDEIKKMGMSKALKTAAGAGAAGRNVGDASAKEWAEGLRRLYTPERVDKLMGSASKGAKSGPQSANTKVYSGPSKPKGAYTKGSTKSTPKKSSLVSTGQKVAAGTLAAGALLATRGRATGLASRLAPGLAKSGVGKALVGSETRVLGDSFRVGAKGSFGKTTSAAAKAAAKTAGKKVGTKAEFATKATEETVRKALAQRAANAGGTFRVGPKGSLGKRTAKAGKSAPSTKKSGKK